MTKKRKPRILNPVFVGEVTHLPRTLAESPVHRRKAKKGRQPLTIQQAAERASQRAVEAHPDRIVTQGVVSKCTFKKIKRFPTKEAYRYDKAMNRFVKAEK